MTQHPSSPASPEFSLGLHQLHPSWWGPLAEETSRLRALEIFLNREVASGREFLPEPENVFRAFQEPFESIRVIIVGQDPYPTPGHSMGLAFSTRPEVQPIPRSLRNIYQELERDLKIPQATTGDLRPWAKQGVLLLNRVLTVQSGVISSHRRLGWEGFTEQVIRKLAARGTPLVGVLWGREARTLKRHFAKFPIIESAHPSPLSATRGFIGSRPFSRTNDLLKQQGADPIDWSLDTLDTTE